MQLITSSTNYQLVARFRDYINIKYSTQLKLAQQDTITNVYIVSDNQQLVDKIQEEFQLYQQNPDAQIYMQASWQNLSHDNVKIRHDLNFAPYLQYLKQPVTTIIFILSTIVFILMSVNDDLAEQILIYSHIPDFIQEPEMRWQIWRYFANTVVHLSFMHYLFNLLWWIVFGHLLETKLGSWYLLKLYIVSAFVSGVAEYFVANTVWAFGLSGVVYALLAYVYILGSYTFADDWQIPQGFMTMLLFGLFLGFAGPLIGLKIGNAAHFSGFLVGLVMGAIDHYRLSKKHH